MMPAENAVLDHVRELATYARDHGFARETLDNVIRSELRRRLPGGAPLPVGLFDRCMEVADGVFAAGRLYGATYHSIEGMGDRA